MLFYALIGGLVVSLIASLLLTPLLRYLALTAGWTDAPDGRRKIHNTPIPNVGGVAIVAAFLLGLGVAALLRLRLPELSELLGLPSFLVVLGAVLIAAVGFWDDLRDLSPHTKFAAQIGVSALAMLAGYRIELFDGLLGGGTLALAVSVALTLIWMVGIMNAVNMMDGMDGVASGVVAIAFCGLAGVYAIGGDLGALVIAVTIIGALLGFLRYNFNPASIFMGDSGSLFLGFMLATYALRGTGHSHPVLVLVIPAVAMGLPILDTMTSMIRRRVQGQSLFSPDRDHIHHRLAVRMPYRSAVLTLYALGLFFAGGAIVMAASTPAMAAAIFLVGVAVVVTFMHRLGYLGGAPARRMAREKAARRLARNAAVAGADAIVAITTREPHARRRKGAAGRSPDHLAPASAPER